jgi:hypothetical protein
VVSPEKATVPPAAATGSGSEQDSASRRQRAEQPSSGAALPSSHSSGWSTRPSPQTAAAQRPAAASQYRSGSQRAVAPCGSQASPIAPTGTIRPVSVKGAGAVWSTPSSTTR